jgi:hypothetical protein
MTGTIVETGDGAASATVVDENGDTFPSSGVPWDLTALTIARDAGGITAHLDLSRDVIAPTSGDVSAVIGFLDLDLDQNPATGGIAVADEFRTDGGSTQLGVDARVDLSEFAGDFTVAVSDSHGIVVGRVRPVFDGRRITIRIPRALLGNDDGFLNAAAIVGSAGRPSDFVPNSGHLTLDGARASSSR